MIYDSLDQHLAEAGAIDRAAIPPGMLLAWCVNLRLMSAEFERNHEREILRLRMQEILGSELFVGVGGELKQDMFSSEGQRFLNLHKETYLEELRTIFGEDIYSIKDNWDSYSPFAKAMTGKLLTRPKTPSLTTRIKRWWNG